MIDDHCHPFSLEGGELALGSVTLDANVGADADRRRRKTGPWRVNQEVLSNRLSTRLGCAVEELQEARREASRDWASYVRSLMDDAGITALVMDSYYPRGAERDVPAMAALADRPIYSVMRLDHIIDDLIEAGMSARNILEKLQATMQEATRQGVVGFKSIIAYRTGLDIAPAVSETEADRSLREAGPLRRRAKACRDWLLRRCIGTAIELGVPFQIHSGLGDSDLRLSEANPLLLEELLRTPEGGAARILIMVGYPWHEELAYLATTKPNVWADLSMFNIHAPITSADRLLRSIDLAPATKILLGSDGHHEPEIFWFGAMVLQEAWQGASSALIAAGARGGWVQTIERRIFHENARKLYGLEGL